MIDEHLSHPDLRDKTLTELYKKRMENKVDPWTVAWLKNKFGEILTAYKGACHAINLAVAHAVENRETINALSSAMEKRMESVEAENQMLMARIGELQAENELVRKRIDDMAEWAKSVKRQLKQD